MLKQRIAISTLSLVMLAGVAAASSGEDEREDAYERRGPVPFELMDRNADGVVSADEHAQMHRERYAYRAKQGYPMRHAADAPSYQQIDTDGNGSVSAEELSSWQNQRMQQHGMGSGR
ncbi:MAG: hypothetical protein LJE59_14160 [Chromatiaceae bacterium]|jgi:Ca2+-binding EF-hand superfamily protein|nr:hypothetical protein [Chromatiaceae bacterium]